VNSAAVEAAPHAYHGEDRGEHEQHGEPICQAGMSESTARSGMWIGAVGGKIEAAVTHQPGGSPASGSTNPSRTAYPDLPDASRWGGEHDELDDVDPSDAITESCCAWGKS
jgi:hypothetical protein